MNKLYSNGSGASSTSSLSSPTSSTHGLPFPAPLPRSDFLTPNFDASTYLSSLGQRHQTLEDLRGDLRARSSQLSAELLELVNSHYEDFLMLGSSLRGGDEKVEEIRLGLLALRREVEGAKEQVENKYEEVKLALEERERTRRDIQLGRRLLEWDTKVERLEKKLMIGEGENGKETKHLSGQGNDDADSDTDSTQRSSDEEDDDDDVDDLPGAVSLGRLKRRAVDFLELQRLSVLIGSKHPMITAHHSRITVLRNTILLDLGTALREAKGQGKKGSVRTLRILTMYRELNAAKESLQVVRSIQSR